MYIAGQLTFFLPPDYRSIQKIPFHISIWKNILRVLIAPDKAFFSTKKYWYKDLDKSWYQVNIFLISPWKQMYLWVLWLPLLIWRYAAPPAPPSQHPDHQSDVNPSELLRPALDKEYQDIFISQHKTKPTIRPVWPAKTRICLYIHPVWQGFSFILF